MSVDTIREKFFASANRRFKDVAIELAGEKHTIRLRQPSARVRARILETGKFDSSGQIKNWMASEEAKALAIINCCVDPESGAPIFNDKDREQLFEQAALFDDLAGQCIEMLRQSTTQEDKEDLGKT